MDDCGLLHLVLANEYIKKWWESVLEQPAMKEWIETSPNKEQIMAHIAKLKANAIV
jgi:hypothetical protein